MQILRCVRLLVDDPDSGLAASLRGEGNAHQDHTLEWDKLQALALGVFLTTVLAMTGDGVSGEWTSP